MARDKAWRRRITVSTCGRKGGGQVPYFIFTAHTTAYSSSIGARAGIDMQHYNPSTNMKQAYRGGWYSIWSATMIFSLRPKVQAGLELTRPHRRRLVHVLFFRIGTHLHIGFDVGSAPHLGRLSRIKEITTLLLELMLGRDVAVTWPWMRLQLIFWHQSFTS